MLVRSIAAWALAAALAAPLGAQNLSRVRIRAEDAPRLADELAAIGFDVLDPSIERATFEAIAGPEQQAELARRGIAYEVLSTGRPFAEIQREELAASPDAVPSGYKDLAAIQSQLAATAAAFPTLTRLVDLTAEHGLPPTVGGRHLWAILVSDNAALDEDEPAVLIVGDHHAREIVTPVIALHALERLTAEYGSNPALTALVDQNEIWIAPVWNPDGYVHVFDVDNWWRKNRRNNGDGTFGVDLNRNYPFGWDSACAGTTTTSSETYRGPAAGSEVEIQTMLAFGAERRFAKLFDYHSYASEVRYGYGCWSHPLNTFFLSEAQSFSQAGGYGGNTASSCCTAGNIHWHGANFGTHAFLWETHTEFQPSYASAQAEAAMLFGGIVALLQRPIPVWGHVTDADSGQPIEAELEITELSYQHGETNGSGGPFGRYHAFLPAGTWSLRFSAPCYQTKTVQVSVSAGGSQQLDVALTSGVVPTLYCTAKPTSIVGCVPALSLAGVPSASSGGGCTVAAAPLPGTMVGLFLYTTSGAAVPPIQNAYGWLCLKTGPGFFRILPALNSGGTSGACDGQLAFDFNAYAAAQTQNPALVAGATVDLQAWYRDPPNPGGANLSGAASFPVCP